MLSGFVKLIAAMLVCFVVKLFESERGCVATTGIEELLFLFGFVER